MDKVIESTINNFKQYQNYIDSNTLLELLNKITEASIIHNNVNQNNIKHLVEKTINEYVDYSIVECTGEYCPYFLKEEIADLDGYYYETNNIVFGDGNPIKRIKTLQNEIKCLESIEDIDKRKQEIISYGWNPEIEYNIENQIKARNRFNRLINEKYNRLLLLDLSSINESEISLLNESSSEPKAYPVNIVFVKGNSLMSNVITRFTNSKFSHAAIALGDDLHRLYSFNFDNKIKVGGGFSLEKIDELPDKNNLAIYTFFVTKKAYNKISDTIQNFLNNIKNTTFSVVNFITYPFDNISINTSNSMICSQFVDSLFKLVNFNFTNAPSSKVSPAKLYISAVNAKAYKIFDGIKKDFNIIKSEKLINKLSRKARPVNESLTLEQDIILSFFNPTPIDEAKKIPIEFNKDGDILLTNPFPDYDAEYSASHKLLMQYEKNNNIDAMKYELARLYYMNYIIEKKLYHNKNLSNKDKNIKTRARILNDFNKYLNYVLSKDNKFNFGEYYEASPFYAHTYEIKSSSILKVKDILKYIL